MIIFCSLHLSSVISIFICGPQIEEDALKSCTLQNIHGVSVFNSTESRLRTFKKEIIAVKWKQFADSEFFVFRFFMIIFCSLLTEDCNKLKASLDLNLNCRQTKLKKKNKKEGKARFLPNAVLFFNCCI